MSDKKPLLAFFGHHKCATTWINSIIRMVCRDLDFKFVTVDNSQKFERKLDAYVKANNIDFLSYTNANIGFVRDLDDCLGFHVIRDPRDIVVSAYFSHLYSHPTAGWPALIEHRERLKKASQEEGLFLVMEFIEHVFRDLMNWDYSQENVLEIKMEDMTISSSKTLVKALKHLRIVEDTMQRRLIHVLKKNGLIAFASPHNRTGAKIPVDILLEYIFQNRFSKQANGRKPGEENPGSHYRKGVAGDWINYFNQEHRRYFRANYTDLLIKLGYEKCSNW